MPNVNYAFYTREIEAGEKNSQLGDDTEVVLIIMLISALKQPQKTVVLLKKVYFL